MLPEVASILNYRVHHTVILNDTTQDNNKVLEDERNETFKFHRLEKITKKAVSTLYDVVNADQRNVGTNKNRPLKENENLENT